MLYTNYHYGCCRLFQTMINCKVPHWRGTFARLFQFKLGIEQSWFPGRELFFSQISNALPTGLKKCLPSPCGSRHFVFRLSPSRCSPTFVHPSFASVRSCSHCHFLLLPLSGCFPSGNHPWTHSIFLACNGLAPIHHLKSTGLIRIEVTTLTCCNIQAKQLHYTGYCHR